MELTLAYIVAMMIVFTFYYDFKFINREIIIIFIFIGMGFIFAIGKKFDDYTAVAIILCFLIKQFIDLKRDVKKI